MIMKIYVALSEYLQYSQMVCHTDLEKKAMVWQMLKKRLILK